MGCSLVVVGKLRSVLRLRASGAPVRLVACIHLTSASLGLPHFQPSDEYAGLTLVLLYASSRCAVVLCRCWASWRCAAWLLEA
jgi:hypothetical protein